MKFTKYLTIVSLAATTLFGCEPLGDLYDEIDADETGVSADVQYTLTEDDYDDLGKSFANFDDEDEAKELIPELLSDIYSHLGAGSIATIGYAIYDPIRVDDDVEYTLTDDDYDAIGESYPNLNSRGDIFKAARYVNDDPSEGDIVTINYDYYEGGVSSRTSVLAYYAGQWYIAYVPSNEDYYAMGQSYTNFESRSTARARIEKLLNTSAYAYGEEGDYRTAVFEYTYVNSDDERQYENFLVVYQHDGTEWVSIEDTQYFSLNFGNDGSTWVPDNTIKYTLAAGDYSAIAANESLGNADARANLASYGNFNTNGGYWTTELIIEAIDFVLQGMHPDAEEGQKYVVTYDSYPGGLQEVSLILEGGVYVVNE
ncbi:hypothetical protein [Marinoscillum pacificum]|uniref:hypothetical protein n=1 Tax=Marinoscillum pacificum TaxID=392723 RepID=UPI002156F74F|nr:hypothetical protein [Marinoscillum pacificum]